MDDVIYTMTERLLKLHRCVRILLQKRLVLVDKLLSNLA